MKRLSISIIAGIFSCSILLAQPQAPDTLWTRTYGGNNGDMGHYVQQTNDGGYIIVGETNEGSFDEDIYLIKTDSFGNQRWTHAYGGSSDADDGRSVQQTTDGGFIIAGSTWSFGAGCDDVYLIKTDAFGNEQWYRTFGGAGNEEGRSVRQTLDGGYIIAGFTNSFGEGLFDVYLIKTDSSGNTQFTHTYGGISSDLSNCVQQTSDGGFIIVGNTSSYGAGLNDIYLIKTDNFGNLQWFRTFGGANQDYGRSVEQTSDGGYIICGNYYPQGSGVFHVCLIKTDSFGNQLWFQDLWSNFGYGESVHQTVDGGYIVTGSGSSNVLLIKTDCTGSQLWFRLIGGNEPDKGYCVQQTTDGGYIISGFTYSYGAGPYDVYLIKMDSETPPNVSLTIIQQNPPIQIPAAGGLFNFDILAANNSSYPLIIDFWTDVSMPNGSIFGPILNIQNLTSPVNWSVSRLRNQTVPGSAPSGEYIYNAYIGNYPNNIFDEDHFTFTKLASNDNFSNSPYQTWECYESNVPDISKDALSALPPSAFILSASPNPFNNSTTVTFTLPAAGEISLKVFDISGREIQDLGFGIWESGTHSIIWDAKDCTSGVYFVRFEAAGNVKTQKVVLLK